MVNMERFLYLGGSCSFSDLARNAAAAAAKLRQSCVSAKQGSKQIQEGLEIWQRVNP